MVDIKTGVLSVVAVLSVFLQSAVRAQPTIDTSAKDDSCSHLEEELELQVTENMRLQSELGSDRQTIRNLENQLHRQKPRELQSVTATLIGSLDSRPCLNRQLVRGITKVENNIYVLNDHPNIIKVFEDLIGCRIVKNISLIGTLYPWDIVYSNESKCLYINDCESIWVMTTRGENQLTKWLTNVTKPCTLSLSNEGHLLVLSQSGPDKQGRLEIYSLNATLIRSLQLLLDIKDPRHVVQTATGNFIISHRLNSATSGPWVISQVTNDGRLINRFVARNQSEELDHPLHLSLDSDNNQLFVADYMNYRVILFDSSDLKWSKILVSNDTPFRMFYDVRKKHLLVAHLSANLALALYEIT